MSNLLKCYISFHRTIIRADIYIKNRQNHSINFSKVANINL